MTQLQAGAASTGRDVAWATVDLAVLDIYAGFYRGREHQVTTIWRDGQKLFTDAPIPGSLGAIELYPVSETEFYPTNGAGYFQYTFLRDQQGAVSAVLVRVQGVEFTFPRIDAAAAEQLKAKLSERIRLQKPLPDSEAMLRRLLEGVQTGCPPFEEMSSQLRQVVRQQLPLLQSLSAYLGAIQWLEFRGVGSEGCDLYDVCRERGTSRWRISLSADGKIASVNLDWDRPKSAEAVAGPADPRS
jgi:hypothetical protein